MYRLKPIYSDRKILRWKVNGRYINLVGTTIKEVIAHTTLKPERLYILPAATQEDLKVAYEDGCHYIEKSGNDTPKSSEINVETLKETTETVTVSTDPNQVSWTVQPDTSKLPPQSMPDYKKHKRK